MSASAQLEELKSSRKKIEDIIGMPVRTMSYPHGSLSDTTMKLAEQAGYELATSSRPGINLVDKIDWFHLRRTEIQSHDNIQQFASKLNGSHDFASAIYYAKYLAGGTGQYTGKKY